MRMPPGSTVTSTGQASRSLSAATDRARDRICTGNPYEETFIVLEGKVRFTLGEETLEATAGQIVVIPAGTPHKFLSTGAGRLRQISIHPAVRMETEWLE